jgi:prepilin-type N-terminal cleavage/methylation domain-containing protein
MSVPARRHADRTGTGRRGFTLLEVMAAVALFGIVYVAIAGATVEGLGLENDARQRLEAATLADAEISRLETEMLAGVPPRIGNTEREDGPFRIEIDVQPFDLVSLGLTPPQQGGRDPQVGTRAAGTPDLLLAGNGSTAPPVLAISVGVHWEDRGNARSVARDTFGLDLTAAAAQLEALAPTPGEPPLDSSGPTNQDDQ